MKGEEKNKRQWRKEVAEVGCTCRIIEDSMQRDRRP